MKVVLTVEECIEAFGRDTVAKALERGLKIQHGYEALSQLPRYNPIGTPEQREEQRQFRRAATRLNLEVR